MKNYYDILGVSEDASYDQIKKAFKDIAKKEHPDRGGDEARFKEAVTHNDKTINYKLPSGRDEFATVKIPAGVQHGVTFKFPGMGDDAIKNVPRGDLMVIMSVLDSDGYTRKGNDLYTDKTIDCFQAIRGHDFNLKTLEDKIIKVKVPAGTQANTILQVKGQGMPVHKTIGIRGNLYVKVHVLIPQLSAADLKKIKDL